MVETGPARCGEEKRGRPSRWLARHPCRENNFSISILTTTSQQHLSATQTQAKRSTMAASSDANSKAWYHRQLDRLHREAPAVDRTTPEDALRHLPIESLAEVIDTTFKNYDTRATIFAERCLEEGNVDTFHAFLKAHHDIMQRFGLPSPNHYRDMARIIGFHFIRKVERKIGIEPTEVKNFVVQIPDSPLSGPPTPGSILSWVNNLDETCCEPQDQEESLPALIVTRFANGISTSPDNRALEATSTGENTESPRRQRHPRKAKTSTVNQESENPPHTRLKRAGKCFASGMDPEKREPTPATTPEKETNQLAKGTKRRRAEDAFVLTEDSQTIQKRRKTAKPTTRSKR